MATPLDFYFDFSSPYGYIGAEKIDALAAKHGRDVDWRPILLGAVFKATGGIPLPQVPLKGPYAQRDFARSAKFHGVDLRFPDAFPIATVHTARAFYWLKGHDSTLAKRVALALLRAYFTRNIDISVAETVVSVAAAEGVDRAALAAALNDPAVKDQLKSEVEAAMVRGVFGSPFVIVDGEPFWGVDRFDQLDRWLATGGW